MNLLMDADCLITLAKSGLKEAVCKAWSVAIPRLVRRETVEQASHLPDAVLIGRNIEAGLREAYSDDDQNLAVA